MSKSYNRNRRVASERENKHSWLIHTLGGEYEAMVLEVPVARFTTQGVSPRRDVDYIAGGQGQLRSCITENTDSGNQSCPEASIPDLAVRINRLFEELSLKTTHTTPKP
jgi:hypothetical protein